MMSVAKAPLRRFGFTYLELITAVFILALVATGLFVRLVASQRGNEARSFRMGIARLATDARQTAIAEAAPVSLQFDESSSRFRIAAGDAGSEIRGGERGTRSVGLPAQTSIQELRLSGNTLAAAEWRVRFYADGSCDPGAIQIQGSGGEVYSVVFDPKTGRARFEEAPLSEVADEEDRWQAGEMERRGG